MDTNNKEFLVKLAKKHKIDGNIVVKNTKFHQNRLFFTSDCVIKTYEINQKEYFKNELYIYKNLKEKKYLAKLYENGQLQGKNYIIISKIDADTLFSRWHNFSEKKRKSIIWEISRIIRKINFTNIEKDNGKFKKEIANEFDDVISNVSIEKKMLKKIKKYFKDRFELIMEDEIDYLIYSDFHFNNFLIDNDNNIFIIDFESLKMAPLDYQMASIIRMCENPYIEANNDDKICLKDYKNIPKYFINSYSEIKKIKKWKERVNLYNLLYDLKAVRNQKAHITILEKYVREE